jgi:hypothetical protein
MITDTQKLLRRVATLEALLLRYRLGQSGLPNSLADELDRTKQWAAEIEEREDNK